MLARASASDSTLAVAGKRLETGHQLAMPQQTAPSRAIKLNAGPRLHRQ